MKFRELCDFPVSHGNGHPASYAKHLLGAVVVFLSAMSGYRALAQTSGMAAGPPESSEQKLERLSTAVSHVQEQMEGYQKLLLDLQQQLADVRQQMAAEKTAGGSATAQPTATAASQAPESSPPLPSEIREQLAIEDSQIATLETTKVETESKYPLKLSGLLLFNAYANTRQVDVAPDPTYAVDGSGSTGFSVRQTILGLDARGPHLFGATSHADVRVDFFERGSQPGYASGGVLWLRTAHAGLKWNNTEAFFAQDRPILSPNTPTSLVAVAMPEFAWAGNLWTWNPQVGVSQQIGLGDSTRLKLQAALIDVANPQLPNTTSTSTISQTERSRWPGSEARIAFASGDPVTGAEIGIGGYFSPHQTSDGFRYDAWAGTADMRVPLTRHFLLTADAYRGQGLGGLGGGGYADFVYHYSNAVEIARALDDVGGWAQLKGKVSERLELNGGYGLDNPFAGEIHTVPSSSTSTYPGLARNRSTFGNVIYSPSAYLLFSLEYRKLWTDYAAGPTYSSDVIGIGAGYRF